MVSPRPVVRPARQTEVPHRLSHHLTSAPHNPDPVFDIPPPHTHTPILCLHPQTVTVKWRGKPVFIRHRTPEEIALAEGEDITGFRDPQTDAERVVDPKVIP